MAGTRKSTSIVTGGTRGVGLAVARRLCEAGYDTHLVYGHGAQAAEEALKSLAGLPGSAYAVEADLRRPGAMDRVLRKVRESAERLDVFVSNAAETHAPAPATQAASARRDLTVALQPLLTGAAGIAEMMQGGPGRIVAVSSIGAGRVVGGYAGPGMAKAALESLVRYLAAELAPRGITVNAVSTSKIDHGRGDVPPPVLEALVRRTPAGRLTTPQDVADVVELLCSPRAGWIHGQVITADGGFSLLA